jgi:hypothetical protein
MKTPMIRKQIYLARAQDRKVKALAAARGTTESEVNRSAIDHLPDVEGSMVEQLAAAGLLLPKSHDPSLPTGDELRKLEDEVYAWRSSLTEPVGLTEAVIEDREGR